MPSANLLLHTQRATADAVSDGLRLRPFSAAWEKYATHLKISYIWFFVVYSTVPLSARGFPAHHRPVKWFSSYIWRGNLTSCNGFTRQWYLATPANCTATCCAARSKCLCNSPPFFWASACPFSLECKRVRRHKALALAVLSAGSQLFVRKQATYTRYGKNNTSLDQPARGLKDPDLLQENSRQVYIALNEYI